MWVVFFQPFQRFCQDVHDDQQALPLLVAQQWRIRQGQATLFERDQAGRQVAAIHRGDVAGWQRCHHLRVVPVHQVSPVMFQLGHALERGAQAHCQFGQAHVSQIERR